MDRVPARRRMPRCGQIMERHFAELPAGVTGLPLSWDLIRDQVATELTGYLNEEQRRAAERRADAGAEAGLTPEAAEHEFQGGADSGREPATAASAGRIDRIDRSGRSPAHRGLQDRRGIARGRGGLPRGSLPAVAGIPARRRPRGSRPTWPRAAPSCTTSASAPPMLASSTERCHSSRLTRASERYWRAMADAIASGAFFYQPGERRAHCRWCDFRDICHTRVADYAKRKAPGSESADGAVSAYRCVAVRPGESTGAPLHAARTVTRHGHRLPVGILGHRRSADRRPRRQPLRRRRRSTGVRYRSTRRFAAPPPTTSAPVSSWKLAPVPARRGSWWNGCWRSSAAAPRKSTQVVVITFTEKAAGELRARVRDRLHEPTRGARRSRNAPAIERRCTDW